MRTAPQSLLALTAQDLMTSDLVRLEEQMPLREAARLLLTNRIGGAPVVDTAGRCVGVFSMTDLLRYAVKQASLARSLTSSPAVTCPFLVKHRAGDGEETALCLLPAGVCPLQVKVKGKTGEEWVVCQQSPGVVADWQLVEVERLPTDGVGRYMTPDPVTVAPESPIRVLARRMLDAHVHRVIVVDEKDRPVGIVSGTDFLAALAYSEAGAD